jgi:hypothetical protein
MQERIDHIAQYYRRFAEVADYVAGHLIRPRMELLASYFDNAEPLPVDDQGHRSQCRYRFRQTDRFPATVTLDLTVCPDANFENILVVYAFEILPVLFPFKGKDQIEFPLDGVDESRLVAWIQEKMRIVFDTYLRLENSERYATPVGS